MEDPVRLIEESPILDSLRPIDLQRMNIGRRWWPCRLARIPDGLAYKDVLKKFIGKLYENVRGGRGLLFHGEFSTGKTAAAVIVAKAVAMYGGTVFFVATSELTDLKIDNTMFDADKTIWKRMQDVELLVIDDLGAEHSTEWTKSLIERLVRLRSNAQKSIVCTTNKMSELPSNVGEGTLAILRSIALPVLVGGTDWRQEEREDLEKGILGEGESST